MNINNRITRRELAGWVWTETRHIEFSTVFCPFCGWPAVPVMFKEQGKGVITADLLLSNFHLARATTENDSTVLDPFDIDFLLENNPDKVQLMEGVCNAYDVAPELGAWFDNLYANISKLDDPLKQSLGFATGIRVLRYFMSFDKDTAAVMADDDPTGFFHYYAEFINSKVFPGGLPCSAYNRDAVEFVQLVDTEAMYFYMPSSNSMEQLPWRERLSEIFVRNCNESQLDAALAGMIPFGDAKKSAAGNNFSAIEKFLLKASHIPLWIIATPCSDAAGMDGLEKTLSKLRNDITKFTRKVIVSSSDVQEECLFIARG